MLTPALREQRQLHGRGPHIYNLFPTTAPGEPGPPGKENDIQHGGQVSVAKNVFTPTLTLYKPNNSNHPNTLVLIMPGGNYKQNSLATEGTLIVPWLNKLNIAAMVLKYRVPIRKIPAGSTMPPHWAPLMDAQRAMGLARQNVGRLWGLRNVTRFGVLGFSAGGHLAAHLSSVCVSQALPTRLYSRIDAADDLSCAPDFQMLVYPGQFQ
jgi:acetyl esterase/lipase